MTGEPLFLGVTFMVTPEILMFRKADALVDYKCYSFTDGIGSVNFAVRNLTH